MERVPRAWPILAACASIAAAAGCGETSAPRTVAEFQAEPPYIPVRAPQAADRSASRPYRPGTSAKAPATRPEAEPLPDDTGAPTDAQVADELEQAFGKSNDASASEITRAASLTANGLATVPPGAPAKLAAFIHAANQVATRPCRYGGGHGGGDPEGLFVDTAYDCSGSISYALASARLIDAPMDSSSLARWGKPGPGKWVTIYANGGHAFMVVAGLRFDTSGRREGGFTVRHPPGL